jgi:hypothetical protein
VVIGGIALKRVGDVKDVFDNGDHPGIFPGTKLIKYYLI